MIAPARSAMLVAHLLLVLTVALPVAAAQKALLPQGIAEAFSPLEGYVVGRHGEGYLVDLGAADGLAAGDLLAVLGRAQTFAHPVTGESVRGLPEVDGVLRVTRVEEEIALTHAAPGAPPPRVGAAVERYAGLPARFLDHTDGGESLYLALRDALPHIEWRGYTRAAAGEASPSSEVAAVAMVFELWPDRLEVRAARNGLVRSYALAGNGAPASPPRARREPTTEPAPASSSAAYRPSFSRAELVANLPDGVSIADFVGLDGRLLMASTDGYRIWVHAIGDDRSVAERSAADAVAGEVVSVHWWQPDGTDRAYLATTSWNGDDALGAVFELHGDRLARVARRVPYILASFDTDGDGRRETLLGQTYVREVFFGRRVHRLALSDGELVKRGDGFSLPDEFTVQGAAFADLTGDGRAELAFVRDHMLHIYSAGGERLYRSPRQIGGSRSWIHYEVDPEFEFSPVNTVSFELSPVALDLDGDGVKELVAVAADFSLLALPGAGPSVKKTWLAVFEYRDGSIVKGRLGPERDFPVQGLTAADDAILLVTPSSTSIIGRAAASQLIAVPVGR